MTNKIFFIIFLIIFSVPFVSADITLTTDLKGKYNLGDPISSSFDVNAEQDFDGLFKLTLFCDNFDIDYFVTLIEFKAGHKITVMPPEIKPAARMEGSCRLVAYVESFDKEVSNKFDSDEFEVTSRLDITSNLDKESAFPGETIDVNGQIETSHNNYDALFVQTAFNGNQEELPVKDGKFTKQLTLPDNIKSGKHILFFDAKDSFGNYADKAMEIIVKPKISKINLELNEKSLKPGETIEIKPVLYDQADEVVLDEFVLVNIFQGRDELFSGNVKSNEKAAYTFLQYTEPGNYDVKAAHDQLKAEETITMEELKKLDIKLEGEIVNINNIGNVRYNDIVNLNLFGEKETYVLNKRIKLNPGESVEIDLSKEVATDNYAIDVVIGKENISLADSEPVPIVDKRTVFGKITGAAIAAGKGFLANKPILGGVIMIFIIAFTILFFVKRRKLNYTQSR